MKKAILLLAAASILAPAAVAQQKLVDEVAKTVASSANKAPQLKAALDQIQPALTNPESKDNVLTWYTAGKASFGLYDALTAMKMLKQDVSSSDMAQALLNGFKYYETALPLDTIPEVNKDGSPKIDKKTGLQKVKVKYSAEIQSTLIAHINDFLTTGNACLGASDFNSAQKAFSAYCDMFDTPFGKSKLNPQPDSVMAEIRFFEGYAADMSKDYENAYKGYSLAKKLGYTKNQVAERVAASMGQIAQKYVDAKDYNGAFAVVDKAIANDPNDANILDLRGRLAEMDSTRGMKEAVEYYKKAVEADGSNVDALFNYGRFFTGKAGEIITANPNLVDAQLRPKVKPYLDQALPLLEKAYSLDKTRSDVKRILRNVYYLLGQTEKVDAIDKE